MYDSISSDQTRSRRNLRMPPSKKPMRQPSKNTRDTATNHRTDGNAVKKIDPNSPFLPPRNPFPSNVSVQSQTRTIRTPSTGRNEAAGGRYRSTPVSRPRGSKVIEIQEHQMDDHGSLTTPAATEDTVSMPNNSGL